MADGASIRTRSDSATEGDAAGTEGSTDRLSFGLIDPSAHQPAPAKRRFPWLAIAFFLGALVAVALLRSVWLRSLLPLALVAGGVVLLVRYRAKTRRRAAKPPRAPRALVLDASGLRYELVRRTSPSLVPSENGASQNGAAFEARRALAGDSRAPLSLLDGSQTFGATLLSNAQRDKLALAITSSHGTFLVGTRLEGEADRRSFAELFAKSSVVGSDESPLDATGPDGQPVCLPAETFHKLFASLVALDPGCARRLVLSDQRGNPIELDGTTLVARGARFDLSRPLEWRPIVFQEPFGHAINLYQGTWIRQGAHEVVLVSLMTPNLFESTLRGAERHTGQLDHLALRDQRLLQAVAADPPPVEQRVAMDGLFVVPLRAALDEAPRASSVESSSRHA